VSYLRWICEPGGEIVLMKAEPLMVTLSRAVPPHGPGNGDRLMSFTLIPPDVGKVCREITILCDTIVQTEEGIRKRVSCTMVPWKTVESLLAAVTEFVENFSDDPVCAVIADALKHGLPPKHQILPLDAADSL
jgi:hypothetical protein